jgi:hypothetical protein
LKHGFDILFAHLEENSETIKPQILDEKFDYNKVSILKLEIDSIDAKGNI